MMIGYGGGYQTTQNYLNYGNYGSYGGGYQMPAMPSMDMYMGGMGAGGGDLNSMMAASYAQMNQQLQQAEARYNNLRVQQGNIQNNNSANLGGEVDLMKLLRQGVLNREEFVAASATQNEIQRMLANFKSDGQISPEEHAKLAQMRSRLQSQLRQFSAEDCKPQVNSDDKSNQQSGALFDLVQEGKISPNTAAKLRQQMAVAAAQQGAEEGGDENALSAENDAVGQLEALDENLTQAADGKAKDRWKLGEQKTNLNPQIHTQQPAYGYGPRPGYGAGFQGYQGR